MFFLILFSTIKKEHENFFFFSLDAFAAKVYYTFFACHAKIAANVCYTFERECAEQKNHRFLNLAQKSSSIKSEGMCGDCSGCSRSASNRAER